MRKLLFLFLVFFNINLLNGQLTTPRNYVFDPHGAIVRINPDQKVIYLIFTADETFEGGETVLQTLEKNNIKGSFFLTGNCLRIKEFEPLIRKIISHGHYVAAHGDDHLLYAPWDNRQISLVTPDSLLNDLRQNNKELERFGINVSQLRYYNPPYQYYNSEHVRLIQSMGLYTLNLTPGVRMSADYTTPDMPNYRSSQELIDMLFEFEKQSGLNGAIILTHPGTPDERTDKLYNRLDEVIKRLKELGYSFERL